jgi:hypothetical protein
VESNFTLISVNSGDIVIESEIIISEDDARLDCYTNISSYPITDTLWHIRLPSSYIDASNYIIRRTALEVYYCFYDNIEDHLFVGLDTYWEFPANTLTRDILRFTIGGPVATLDKEFSNTTRVDWVMNVPRLANTLRTYTNVKADLTFNAPFTSDYEVAIYDETGGIGYIQDITLTCNLVTTVLPPNGELNIVFDIGTILSGTDYNYRIVFYIPAVVASFWSNWGVILVIVGATSVVGYFMGPSFGSLILNRTIRSNKKNNFKYGLPSALILGGSILLIYYAAWASSHTPGFF